MSILPQRHRNTDPSFKRAAASLVAAAALSFILLYLSASYLAYVKGTIQQDSKCHLEELGNHISESLTSEIRSTNDVLESLALGLPSHHFRNEDEALGYLKKQADFWKFHDMAYIDEDGISHHVNGNKDTLNRALISEALKSSKTVYDLQIADDEDCVIFVTPLSPSAQKEMDILAISGTYAVHNWNMLMDIDIYNHQAVTHVITNTGVVITRDREKTDLAQYNLLESLRDARFEHGVSPRTIQTALQNGEHFQTSYTLDGTDYYLGCEPIGFNNWSLVFTVPAIIVNQAGVNMARSVVVIGAGLTLVFLLVFMFFLIFQFRTRKVLWHMAYQDPITGGANKNKFELDASSLLSEPEHSYMLVYLNIRQFKMLNRRFGKQEADGILLSLYSDISQMISPQECCGHLSADNFVMLLESDTAIPVTERLECFAREHAWQKTATGTSCPIRLVFGLCEAKPDSCDLTQLIDQANLAMKTLPLTGEICLAVYDASMMEQATREKELTERLLQKDVYKEFYICLQPKVDLITRQVVGAEALARWNSPEFGFISPGEFVPLAEKVGVICEIDWLAFESVCKILKSWESEGKPLVPISFNLSKAQLSMPGFLDHYRAIIRQYHVPCEYLDFEFTESILYENTDALREAVFEIHEMGCLCSVDDFGFGYSSLGLLGQFEADTLKLDRSFFLRDACPDSRNNQIVRNIIHLADSLDMHTVAEGVEDQEHVEMLKQFGCGSIQGYIFAKPLSIPDFEVFVNERIERKISQ